MPRTLPPEILRMTFEKVSDKSTLCNILLACQQFRQLVESARVYADAAFSKHPIRFKLDSFLKAIEGPRALFVRSLTFDAEDIRHHELKVIDEILMKTTNLKALCLERRTLPHVRFLQNPPFLLTKLELRDIPLDTPTVRFLEAQTSLEFLSIRTHISGPLPHRFSPSAFPNLKTLVTECKVLDRLASVPPNITHLYIKLSGYFSSGPPRPRRLDSVLVLACHMESSYVTTLCVKTEWLELHGIMDASSDLAIVLRTCQRHTLRGIRLVISPYAPIQPPVQFQQRFDEAPSLEFVEVCNTTGQHHECRRWYRDSPQPVKIRWKCQRGSEWQADWLKDVDIVEGTNLVET
ncbi:hypothetical protein PC9H_011109 [Pleurotus ostreatus]|nr:uncharacterized protein PC9H_011109 [Pleurotus ostreatus]KAF7422945.1 hypothetical protein PC9H_011109 [Pleurotus ostreatus]KAG9227213.1 hypothetical protein CCMSSC00406_0004248 [Pleurotus cornucopiae]KAJ8691075.1 hypothetical protein PTI98_010680 [Pleurotus ostreatus]